MKDYKVMNNRIRKPINKVVILIFSILLIALGVIIGSFLGVMIGILLIWSAFFIKYTIVNEVGIVVNYDAKIFKYKEEWLFKEITSIHREDLKDPQYTILHFTKGAMSKRLVFDINDAEAIVTLALNNNRIHFDKAT